MPRRSSQQLPRVSAECCGLFAISFCAILLRLLSFILNARTPKRSGHRHRYAACLPGIAGIESRRKARAGKRGQSDNPNVNAHQCPGGKPLRGVSQTYQRIRGRSGGRETVGGDLAILAEPPWSLAPRWLHAGMSVHTTMSGKTRIE